MTHRWQFVGQYIYMLIWLAVIVAYASTTTEVSEDVKDAFYDLLEDALNLAFTYSEIGISKPRLSILYKLCVRCSITAIDNKVKQGDLITIYIFLAPMDEIMSTVNYGMLCITVSEEVLTKLDYPMMTFTGADGNVRHVM